MTKLSKILIIIQRSNGDVFLSATLINSLYDNYNSPQIDLLVNEDTLSLAKLLPNVNSIYCFSYDSKHENRWKQEKKIFNNIFRKYDLCINLTASDRSVIYAALASKKSISAIEKDNSKSWWKKLLLSHYYYFDNTKHILLNNLEPLHYLKISSNKIQHSIDVSDECLFQVKNKLLKANINDFIIFHPSAQYDYKIYPQHNRKELLTLLNTLGIPIIITGSSSDKDLKIKETLLPLNNVFDFIGETSLEEYLALSKLSLGYIGMDTLNMHIAASYNKRIFAIFGPTNLNMWSPWSNKLQKSATENRPIQVYDNITIFQANMPCVACGNAGCDNKHGKSECLDHISPQLIFDSVKAWYENV